MISSAASPATSAGFCHIAAGVAARFIRWSALLAAVGLLAGCASAPAPQMENNLESFAAGIDATLKVGMKFKDARATLRATMPPPSMDIERKSPTGGNNVSMQVGVYLMAWPTFDPGVSLVVTMFCDRDGILVRWTTGTLIEK